MKIAILLLAAGSSKRMKTCKQLLNYQGKSLLQHAIDMACSLPVSDCILITGARQNEVLQKTNTRTCVILHNKLHQSGMGSSLKLGIKYLIEKGTTDAVLVMLCDQPLIPKRHYETLISKAIATNAAIITSSYKDTLGVPAVFNASLFEGLAALKNEQGAKSLIYNPDYQVVQIPCVEAGVDIDTPADYARLKGVS